MGYFQVSYNSRVVIYNCRAFIILATGLVVMGRDSHSKGRGFESRHWMDIFSHIFVVKIVMFLEKTENKRKRGRGWPIFK